MPDQWFHGELLANGSERQPLTVELDSMLEVGGRYPLGA
jgi:hypothetical protein